MMRPRGPARIPPSPNPDEFCLRIGQAIVADPALLKVASVEGNNLVIIELSAPSDEIGRVVGRDGRTIFAIRTLAEALGVRINKRIVVDAQVASRPGNMRS